MGGKGTNGRQTDRPPHRQSSQRKNKRRDVKLGPQIKTIRENHRMKRSTVIRGFYRELENLEPESNSEEAVRSEGWLARVENSDNTISARDLELLFRAMNCTYGERTRILVDGERTPLITPVGKKRVVAAFITFAMLTIYDHPEVAEMIVAMVEDERVYSLDRAEVWEIFTEILTLVKPPVPEIQREQRTDTNMKRAGRT
jgi:hypothetical protein